MSDEGSGWSDSGIAEGPTDCRRQAGTPYFFIKNCAIIIYQFKVRRRMEVFEILKTLREKNNLTQEEMANRVNITRQAVSRWETGETQPNPQMLKVLSREFNVSINTLLGSTRQLFCQCCGMPLTEDSMISRGPDQSFNEDYCKWCYTDGEFIYKQKDSLIDFLLQHMPNPQNQSDDERRKFYDSMLSQLKHWKA